MSQLLPVYFFFFYFFYILLSETSNPAPCFRQIHFLVLRANLSSLVCSWQHKCMFSHSTSISVLKVIKTWLVMSKNAGGGVCTRVIHYDCRTVYCHWWSGWWMKWKHLYYSHVPLIKYAPCNINRSEDVFDWMARKILGYQLSISYKMSFDWKIIFQFGSRYYII